jgi:murein DD-endopeptidase MepM/ murein hydrolase activator NlpD
MPKQSPRKNPNWFSIERIAQLLSEETGESTDVLKQDLEKWNSDFIRQKQSTITETSDDDGETTRLLAGSLFAQIQRKVLEAYCSDRGYQKPCLWLASEAGESNLTRPSMVEAKLVGQPAPEARPVRSVGGSSFESSSVALLKPSYPVKEAEAAAEASNAEAARQNSGAEAKVERQKLIRAAETASAEAVALREQLETARQQIASLNAAAESSNAETARPHYLRLSREWRVTLAATGIGLGAYMLAATFGLVWLDRELRSAEAHLDEFSEIQNAVVQRLTERTLIGMDMIERVVAMTGLNINVSDDYLIADDPQRKFQTSVVLLDQQMARWKALQEVVRTIPLVSPLDQYRMTSGFGERADPVNGRKAAHYGVDLKTPVMATAAGTVVFASRKGDFGRMIEIDHGNGIRTRYGHLRKILVEPGQEVSHREEIGLLGNSGRSTGPHVHYEILVDGEPRNPADFVTAGHYAFKG